MASRHTDKVLWGEGMLVCPQHLQQQDLYFEQLIHRRAGWANPYGWGVSKVQFDEAALKNGELRLLELQAILPGGIVLDFAETDSGMPSARSVSENFPANAAVSEVYIGVAALREGTENYTRPESPAPASIPRYSGWTRDVVDLVRAESEVQIIFAEPKACILFGNEDRQDFETLKLAELRRDQTGSFEFVADFVPTCPRLSGSTWLQRSAKELVSLMLTKRRALVEALRQVDSSRVEFTAQDVTRYLQLGAINSHLPMMRQLSEASESTPFSLYAAMSQLAGQLTSFSVEIAPDDLPLFNHLDLRETFSDLLAKLRILLALAMQETFIDIPLEARRDGMWIGVLKDPRLAECPVYVLSVETDGEQQQIASRVPQLSKIASWKQISQIVRSAIPGAPLTAAHRPPPQIPIRPRLVYFTVNTTHEYWTKILEEKTIAIFLPPPFDPSRAKIKLMAVPHPK